MPNCSGFDTAEGSSGVMVAANYRYCGCADRLRGMKYGLDMEAYVPKYVHDSLLP